MIIEAAKLLPCPFCGGDAEIIEFNYGENAGGACVACRSCQASGPVQFEFKESYRGAWNRRAPSQPPASGDRDQFILLEIVQAEAEKLRKMLDAGSGDTDPLYAAYNALLMVLNYGVQPPSEMWKEPASGVSVAEGQLLLNFQRGDTPDTTPGHLGTFLALTENADGRRFVIPAYYLNAHPLSYDEDCAERGCPKDENHDDGCPTTGWFYDESNFEYDNCYHPISAKVLAWARIPKSDAVIASLAASPVPPGGAEREAVTLDFGEVSAHEYVSVPRGFLENCLGLWNDFFVGAGVSNDDVALMRCQSEMLLESATPPPPHTELPATEGGEAAHYVEMMRGGLDTDLDTVTGIEVCSKHKIELENEHKYGGRDEWCDLCEAEKEIEKAIREKHGVVAIHPNRAAAILKALRRSRPSPAPSPMQAFHDAWGYAKEHPEQHTHGYDKAAFGYVQFWLDKLAHRPSPAPKESASHNGFVCGDGSKPTKWVHWGPCGPVWKDDPWTALRFARREDADAFCAENIDVWRIITLADAMSEHSAPKDETQ